VRRTINGENQQAMREEDDVAQERKAELLEKKSPCLSNIL